MTRIAVSIYPQHTPYADFRRAAQTAEALGVDIVYVWDHFFPLMGDAGGSHFECWSLLAALAEVTERVGLGPLVACNSYRNPELLADIARTVDHVSGGRVILGIGSGWAERDYTGYGYEFGTAASRLRELGEALPRIEARLAKLNPPALGPLPILIGGGGEKVTLQLVARHADLWHGFGQSSEHGGPVATVRHKLRVLDEWCERVGRPASEVERSIGLDADTVPMLDEFAALGVHEFSIGVGAPEFDFGNVEKMLAWRDASR